MVRTVLIIDDSPDFREIVSTILVDHDFDVYEASCPADAFVVLEREKVDLIICDLHMPFTNDENASEYIRGNKVGVRTIQELGWVFPYTPIICISAATKEEVEEAAAELGDLPLLAKPIGHKELLTQIEKSFQVQYHHEIQ